MWCKVKSRFAVCIKDSEDNSMIKVKADSRMIVTQKLIYPVCSKGFQESRNNISKEEVTESLMYLAMMR